MIEKVIKTYKTLNNKLIKKGDVVNNLDTRNRVAVNLESKLQHCNVVCDETNNTKELAGGCMCIARVQWINKAMELTYVDLIFGIPEQVKETSDKLETINYWEKQVN